MLRLCLSLLDLAALLVDFLLYELRLTRYLNFFCRLNDTAKTNRPAPSEIATGAIVESTIYMPFVTVWGNVITGIQLAIK